MTDCKDIPRLIERLRDCKRGLTTATPDDYNQWLQALEAMQKDRDRWKERYELNMKVENLRIAELEGALRENGEAFAAYGDHVRQAGCYAIADGENHNETS